ncbi:MAG: efflux RND transporter periplasmic adaptor subunit [Myxococcota bacterium]
MVKKGLVAALGVALVAAIAWGLRPRPLTVDIATATVGPMVVTVDENGRTRVKDRYVVGAPLGGRVSRSELEPGDEVKESDVLARILPVGSPLMDDRSRTSAQARVAAARAARAQTSAHIARAKASLAFAKREAERMRSMAREGTVSQQGLDRALMQERTATAELDSANFGAHVAKYELKMAKAALGHLDDEHKDEQLDVTTPITGRVLRVIQKSEGVVAPGVALIEVGDPAALEIVVDVLTRDAVRIEPGASVSIVRWGGPPLEGRVRRVEPSAHTRMGALGVEEQRVDVVIDLVSPRQQWERLGDGFRVEVQIAVWSSDRVLQVPASSVFRHGTRWAVYRVSREGDDDVAKVAEIEVGHRNGRMVEVSAGLAEGDRLIVHPSDQVEAGSKVAPR